MKKDDNLNQEGSRHNLKDDRRALNAIFAPKNVAVIGATEKPGSVGRTIIWNLIRNPFGGTVFPVNPKRSNILGIKAYKSIGEIPDQVDLAVVVTPARTVPNIMRECVAAGVRGAIIISAGFKEIGEEGAALEQEILDIIHAGNIRVIGPNCLGVMTPYFGLNATFASEMARPGNVAFISQSGALCTSILDWSLRENVGFSAFVSIGSMLDIGWGDLIYYLGDDPRTNSIVMYMESIGDARAFLSAAREVALTKPIIVIKAGRTEEAAKAAASHTGALAGSSDVLEAALRRIGVLQVEHIHEIFYMAEIFGKQPRPKGPNLTILTNAGGPGVLATDALIKNGGKLAQLSEKTIEELDAFLPPHWSHDNPIDILGDADPERYARAVKVAATDPNSDGLLVILTPQAMTDPTQTAETVRAVEDLPDKPLLASWMGGAEVAAGETILNRASIPTFPYPDTAARIFTYMWRYAHNLQALYETPSLPEDAAFGAPDREKAGAILSRALASERTILTEHESKQLLQAYRIPLCETHVATSEEAAVEIAASIGYPVVVKLHSETITHKTDVGGVALNLSNEAEVRQAFQHIRTAVSEKAGAEHFAGVTVQKMVTQIRSGYEIIIGSSLDPQFGPVLLFGSGGQLVEVYKDRALALPPLNTTLARRMMERTKLYQALKGVRGRRAVNLDALEKLMVRFSQIVVEQPRIKEIDINPLLALPVDLAANGDQSILALDARVILHPHSVPDAELPAPAIRPYPNQYVSGWTLRDGTKVTIRPIRPEDEPLIVAFHGTLSDKSVYFRYLHYMDLSHRTSHERLARMCFVDYDREMVLVVEHENKAEGKKEIIAVGRLSRQHAVNEAEFAILVTDRYQRSGIGTELLQRLIRIGKEEGLRRINALILPENTGMLLVSERVGFTLEHDVEENIVRATIAL